MPTAKEVVLKALENASAMNKAVEDAIASFYGHKITGRDLKTILPLLLGSATRKDIEATTGLDKQAAKRAIGRLRDQLGVVVGGVRSDPGSGCGGQSDPPKYSIPDRVNILEYLIKQQDAYHGGAQGDPRPSEPLSYISKKEIKEGRKEKRNSSSAKSDDNPVPREALAGIIELPFDQHQALEQFNGLAVGGKADRANLKTWQAHPESLFRLEAELWETTCPAYKIKLVSLSDRNRLFEYRYNQARQRAGLSTSPKRATAKWRGDLILARQLADSLGVPYEVFIQSAVQKYARLHHDGVLPFAFPSPQHLKYGEEGKAQEAFFNYENELVSCDKAWVLEMEPPLNTDEFDLDDPIQIAFFKWVWEKIVAAGGGLDRLKHALKQAIDRGLIPLAVATTDAIGVYPWLQKELQKPEYPYAPAPTPTPALPECFGKDYSNQEPTCGPCGMSGECIKKWDRSRHGALQKVLRDGARAEGSRVGQPGTGNGGVAGDLGAASGQAPNLQHIPNPAAYLSDLKKTNDVELEGLHGAQFADALEASLKRVL